MSFELSDGTNVCFRKYNQVTNIQQNEHIDRFEGEIIIYEVNYLKAWRLEVLEVLSVEALINPCFKKKTILKNICSLEVSDRR